MDEEIEIKLAQMTGQISALKMVLSAVLGRYAREFGDDAEDFIMTITSALSASSVGDEQDPASRVALDAYADMAEQIEAYALERLDP